MIDEATRWVVLVHSGGASEGELAAYRRWREASPAHERVCAGLEERLRLFRVPKASGLGSQQVHKVIATPSSRRDILTGALCLGGLAVGAALLHGSGSTLGLGADMQTGLSERRTVDLADGSRLIMNARTSIDVNFTERQRHLHLREGEVLVYASRFQSLPLVVTTPAGQAAALEGELMLSHGRRSRAVALNAPLAVTNLAGARITLAPRQEVWFDGADLGVLDTPIEDVSAWTQGGLEVRNRALGDVIEAMRAYRRGILRVSERAAPLQVSGRFRLDDSDQMLDALARVLPIQVTSLSRFWVSIDRA